MHKLPEVRLAPITLESSELYRAWVNDPVTNQWMLSGVPPVEVAQERDIVEHLVASESDEVFEIVDALTAEPVGLIGIHHIDCVHRNAELGVLVGRDDRRGRGFGAAGIGAILMHAFVTRGLENVYLGCFAENTAAIRTYERCGFTRVGTSRSRYFRHGTFHDSVLFDMTREDWERSHPCPRD